MARRSIWDDEENDQELTATNIGWGTQLDVDESAPDEIQPERPATILDQLRTAEPKIQTVRDRSWECANPNKRYRKVPNQIRDAIKDIAAIHSYNTSQIAQAFLEYAMMCYHRGDFDLELELDRRGLTLIPGGWSSDKKPIWAEHAWGKQSPPKKKRRQKIETPLWKQAVNYRMSPELIASIDAVCEVRRSVDGALISRKYHDGEVVARFLTFAIEAYNAGKFALQDTDEE